jgi:hypothetical protein
MTCIARDDGAHNTSEDHRMNRKTQIIAAGLAVSLGAASSAHATQDPPHGNTATENLAGLHDFDFLQGDWRVHHRKLNDRLVGSHSWTEFDGTCSTRLLMGGYANVDDNVLDTPDGTYRGVALRSYDPKTGEWTIWWLDGRMAGNPLDPPVKGRFENGVGTFYSDDTLRGKPIRVRYTWSHVTARSAEWEQAFSPDGGKTWEVNWHMDFVRAPDGGT